MLDKEDLINLKETLIFYAGEMALEPTDTWEEVEGPALVELGQRVDAAIALFDQGYILAAVQYDGEEND